MRSSEERALELIKERGTITQSELWKELDVSSRHGSRLARRLADKDLIERSQTIHNGNQTYELSPVEEEHEHDWSLLMAGDRVSPFISDEQIDINSQEFDTWILELAQQEG